MVLFPRNDILEEANRVKKENEYFCIRQIDPQGRLVLPKEIRDRLGIVEGKTPLKLSLNGDSIVIKIPTPSCFICGETENTIKLKEKHVCEKCLEKLNEIKKINE